MAPPTRAQSRVGPCRPLLNQPPLTIENLPTRIQNGDCIVLPPKFNPPICHPQSACNPCQPPCTPCCPPYCYPCYPPCPPPMCCPPPCPVQVVCAPPCQPCTPCMPCPCTPCMPSPPPPPCCPPPPCPPPACQPCVPQSCCCSPRKQIVCVPRKAQQLTGGPVGTMSPCSGGGGGGDTKSQGPKGLPGLGDQPASYNNCNFYLSDAPKSMRDKFGKARSARSSICREEEEDDCEEESDECVEDEECMEDDECEDMNIAAGDDQIMNPPVGYPGSTRTPWGGAYPGLGKGFPGTGRGLSGRRTSGGSGRNSVGGRNSGGGRNSVGGRSSGGTRSSRGSGAASQGGTRDYGKSRHGTAVNGRQTATRLGSNGSRGSYGRTGGLNSHGRPGAQSSYGKNGSRDPYGTMGTYGSLGRSGMGPDGSRYTANTTKGGNPSGREPGAEMYGDVSGYTGRGGGTEGAYGKQSHLNGQSSANKSRYKSGASASILAKSAGFREYSYGNEELIKKSEAYLPEMYDIAEYPSNQSSTSKFVHPSRAPLPTVSCRSTQKSMPMSHDFGHTTSQNTRSRSTMKPSGTSMTPTRNAYTQPSRSNIQSHNKSTLARTPTRTATTGYSTRPHSRNEGISEQNYLEGNPNTIYSRDRSFDPSQRYGSRGRSPRSHGATQRTGYTSHGGNTRTGTIIPHSAGNRSTYKSRDPSIRGAHNATASTTLSSHQNLPSSAGNTLNSRPWTGGTGYTPTGGPSSHYNPQSRNDPTPTQFTSQRSGATPTHFSSHPSDYPSYGKEAALSKSYTEPEQSLSRVAEERSGLASRSSTQTRLEIFDRPNQPSEIRVTQKPVQISRSETSSRIQDSTYGQSGSNIRKTKSLEDSQARSFYGPDEGNYNAGASASMSGYNPQGNNSGNNSRNISRNVTPSQSQSRINMDSYSKEDLNESGNPYGGGGGSNRRDDSYRPKPKTCIKYHTRRLHRLCSISNQRQKRLSQIHKPIYSIRTPECPVRETHASILRKKPPAACTGRKQKVPQFHEYCMTDHRPDTNRYPLLTREFSPLRHEYENDANAASGFETRGAKRKHYHR